jgi:phosphodiesterase/alkaline phosphatase D-like protein
MFFLFLPIQATMLYHNTHKNWKGYTGNRYQLPLLLLWCMALLCSSAYYNALHGQRTSLRSGPMVGYSTAREVPIWLQTKSSSQVQLRYWPQQSPKAVSKTPVLTTHAAESFIARIILTELTPGTTYNYAIYLDGRKANLPYPTTFQTQALWAFRTEPPNFKCALGSCNYVVDSIYDRPGKPYGGDYHIFVTMSRAQPDMMLWLGDNTYLRSRLDFPFRHRLPVRPYTRFTRTSTTLGKYPPLCPMG